MAVTSVILVIWYKSNEMCNVIWLSGYQSKRDIHLLSENCGIDGYFGYLGYQSKQDIPSLSENCGYGGYIGYLGCLVKK